MDILIQNGTVVNAGGSMRADVLVQDGRISAVGPGLSCADARRIETEKAVAAAEMRARLLKGHCDRLQKEQLTQEQLYQDILKEREETISKLQDQPKRRPRKRNDVLDQQISLNDLLKEV